MHPALPSEALARVLVARGLAAPVAVEPIGTPRICATWKLTLGGEAPETWYLHALLWSPGWDPLATSGAALAVAHGIEGLPVVPTWYQPATALMGRPVALSPALPGIGGDVAIGKHADGAERVGEAIGGAMARLFEVEVQGPALRGTVERGFVPARASWADAWRQFTWMWQRRVAAQGTGLGPLSDRLLAQVEAGRPALETARRFTLVHRDLHPGSVRVSDDAQMGLTGVLDWTGAMLGDPLVEWLQPLMFPLPLLRAVVRGFGVERTRELFDAEAVARLDVYLATRVLARLSVAGAPPWFGPGGRTRAKAIELAHATAERIVQPGWLEDRVAAMLAVDRAVALDAPRALNRVRVAQRQALERLRLVPEPTGTGVVLVVAALALAGLAEREPLEPLLKRAHALLDAIESAQDAGPWEPIADRPAAIEALAILGRPGRMSGALARLAVGAIARLDGAVDDSVLRGLEGALVAQAAWELRAERPSGRLRVALALVAPVSANELADAWDALYPPTDDADGPLPAWDPSTWWPGSLYEALLPAIRQALSQDRPLPARPAAMWAVLSAPEPR